MSLSLNVNLLKEFSYNKVFVETGTHTGGGVQIALDCGFDLIRSIEINRDFHYSAFRTFRELKNVELYFGDSSTDLFWNMIKDIDQPITFMLDAHLASGDPLGDNLEVPLMSELSYIDRHPIKNHTILIDDVRGFGYNPNIDPNLSKEWVNVTHEIIIDTILKINPNYEISYRNTNNGLNDLLVATVKG